MKKRSVNGVSDSEISLSELQQIDTICVEFERGWITGSPIDLDVALNEAPSELPQLPLFRELLKIEVTYRRRNGECPDSETYRERFPDLTSVLTEVFAEKLSDTFSNDDATSPTISSNDSADLAIGTDLGPYRILAKLGKGGMGTVYKVQHLHLDRTVALKVLSPFVTRHVDAVSRFQREMKAIGKVDHPHIVRAMDAGEIHGIYFLTMEYVDGIDLQKYVQQHGPLPIPMACEATRQAAVALTAAHAAGLVHRDLKPANLLLAHNGQFKLLDLGLARLGDDATQNTELTQTGQVFGTPDYMAPEQWEDAHAVDPRTDLYALGCTLHFLLVGSPPYGAEKHRTAVAKMKAHATAAIPELSATRLDVPDEVTAIYRKLMAKSPMERFQTATELVEALSPFTSVSTQTALTPTVMEAVPTVSFLTTAIAQTATVDGGKRWSMRNIAAAGGAAAMLLLGVIVITILNQDGSKTQVFVPADAKQIDIIRDSKGLVSIIPQVTATTPAAGTTWHGWPADAPKAAIAPFDGAQAKKHQEEWAAYLKIPVGYTNTLGMKLRLIPPGEFVMGSTTNDISELITKAIDAKYPTSWLNDLRTESPQRQVTTQRPLAFGETEVTIGQFRKFVESANYFTETEKLGGGTRYDVGRRKDVLDSKLLWNAPGYSATDDCPVTEVTWSDAVAFCNWLSEKEQLKPVYRSVAQDRWESLEGTNGYRLPTEAEWEYACRAGTTTQYSYGDEVLQLEHRGWYDQNSEGAAHPVGMKMPNAFGLFDMHANVSEWSQDWYERNENDKTDAIRPGRTSDDLGRVVRGGNWREPAIRARSAYRSSARPRYPTNRIGFRVILIVDSTK